MGDRTPVSRHPFNSGAHPDPRSGSGPASSSPAAHTQIPFPRSPWLHLLDSGGVGYS